MCDDSWYFIDSGGGRLVSGWSRLDSDRNMGVVQLGGFNMSPNDVKYVLTMQSI